MRMRFAALLVCALSACGPSGPAMMEFVEIIPPQPRIGDVVTVRFKLLDYRGVPMAGQSVDFKFQAEKAGVTLSPTSAVSLKGSGFAETQVVATARVNSVIVVATAGDKQIITPPITFAGTVPHGRQFTFQCGELAGTSSGGIHAIGAYDPARYLIAGVKLNCNAHVGDRNGDGVEGALVSFMTEAGTIGPTDTSKSDVAGNTTVLYKTSLPLPVEVPPEIFSWTPANDATHTGHYVAPLWMHPFEWVENPTQNSLVPIAMRSYTLREPRRPDPIRLRPDGTGRAENNPRDNLVSMIAVTSGEEGFTDSNNNGVYDQGEVFDDLTEPFVDSNDNGTWDPDERFIDVNGNRNWDGKNDRWDANTLIWTQERVLWTGIPATQDSLPVVPGVANHRTVFASVGARGIQLRCPGAVGSACGQAEIASGGPAQIDVFLADPWFNSLAQNSEGDDCTLDVSGGAPVKMHGRTRVPGVRFTYPPGELMTFWVGDARDPNLPPAQQVPKRQEPIGFTIPLFCTYTAAQLEGHQVRIGLDLISGDID